LVARKVFILFSDIVHLFYYNLYAITLFYDGFFFFGTTPNFPETAVVLRKFGVH